MATKQEVIDNRFKANKDFFKTLESYRFFCSRIDELVVKDKQLILQAKQEHTKRMEKIKLFKKMTNDMLKREPGLTR